MSLYTIGRVCLKIAGRDAGNKCVVVENVDANFVLVDGATRRKKVNIKHLEPLKTVIEIKKGASHDEVKVEFEKMGLKTWDKKAKESKERLRKEHKKKVKPVKKKATPKKVEKPKTEVKEEVTEKKVEEVTKEE